MDRSTIYRSSKKTSLSYADVIRKLGLKVAGSNYDTVKRKIKEFKIGYFPYDRSSLESRRKISSYYSS